MEGLQFGVVAMSAPDDTSWFFGEQSLTVFALETLHAAARGTSNVNESVFACVGAIFGYNANCCLSFLNDLFDRRLVFEEGYTTNETRSSKEFLTFLPIIGVYLFDVGDIEFKTAMLAWSFGGLTSVLVI